MAKRTGYAPGTPSWIDIGTDVAGATPFYTALFGWDAAEAGPPEETGGYGFFLKDGAMVAGYGPQHSPGPPFWASYVSVDDADAVAARVQAAGGSVVVEPMDVMTAGRMAVFQDPQGGFISVWQPQDHTGAGLVNEPGSFCWTELHSRDVDGSKAFYETVFGWSGTTHTDGPMPYTEFANGDRAIAGLMPMPPMVPAAVPTHWVVYFAVADTDASIATVQALGGSVVMAPMDIHIGRFAIVADPQGAPFGIIALTSPAD